MGTHGYEYQKVRKMLMPQLQRCRDRNVRVRAELLLYGLKIGNVRIACQRLGFGKSFYYKWWNRLVAAKFKIAALQDRSRRPKQSPEKVSGYIEKRIAHYRRKGFGPEMIQQYLIREGIRKLSLATIHQIICKRKPPKRVRRVKIKKHRKRYELPVPGQRLQLDVKYSPMPVAGETVYIYVAVDECTRWRYAKAYPAVNEHWTADFLSTIKRRFPFPIHAIQTDNGHEFTFKLLTGKDDVNHLMRRWCVENGVQHRLIPPGLKELNGKVERSHRIDADYFYGRAPTSNLKAFNRALEDWIRRYNTERPHGGIGYMTPLEKLKERLNSLQTTILNGEDEEAKREVFIRSVKLIDRDQKKKVAA